MSTIKFDVNLDVDNKDHMLAATSFFNALAGNVPEKVDLRKDEKKAFKTSNPKTEAPFKGAIFKESTNSKDPKTEPAKTEPAKTEPAKTEPAKTEPAKTEVSKEGITVEFMRALAMKKAMASTANKDANFNWLQEKGFKRLTEVPADMYPEYKIFLEGMEG